MGVISILTMVYNPAYNWGGTTLEGEFAVISVKYRTVFLDMFLGFPFPDFAVRFSVFMCFPMFSDCFWDLLGSEFLSKKSGKPDLVFKDFFENCAKSKKRNCFK